MIVRFTIGAPAFLNQPVPPLGGLLQRIRSLSATHFDVTYCSQGSCGMACFMRSGKFVANGGCVAHMQCNAFLHRPVNQDSGNRN